MVKNARQLSQASPMVDVRQGDAYDLMGTLAPESVDLIITSPPYWGLRTYGHDHNEHVLQEWRDLGEEDTTPPSYEWYRNTVGGSAWSRSQSGSSPTWSRSFSEEHPHLSLAGASGSTLAIHILRAGQAFATTADKDSETIHDLVDACRWEATVNKSNSS